MFSVLFLAKRVVSPVGYCEYCASTTTRCFELNGREKLVVVVESSVAGLGVLKRFFFSSVTHFSLPLALTFFLLPPSSIALVGPILRFLEGP